MRLNNEDGAIRRYLHNLAIPDFNSMLHEVHDWIKLVAGSLLPNPADVDEAAQVAELSIWIHRRDFVARNGEDKVQAFKAWMATCTINAARDVHRQTTG